MPGPLAGLRVLELGGIGPGPHAAMLLADLGADVVRVERPRGGLRVVPPGRPDWLLRGRRLLAADLKEPEQAALVLALIERADVVVEGFRPGAAERLGVGPDAARARNPRLVYARMTGWGQDGPRAQRAGHDINYLSLTGVLHAIGTAGARPTPPLNLVGDFGGGSLYLVMGVLAALWERERSGEGQVIDAAIVDGVSSLAQGVWGLLAAGVWRDEPASNLVDSGAPFYDTYACADGKYVAVGAIEPQFYAALLAGLGLRPGELPAQHDRPGWPVLRERFATAFATKTRDEWAAIFEDTDACVTPVLDFSEATADPHLTSRHTLVELGGAPQAAPAPRFSRTVPEPPAPPPEGGGDNDAIRRDWGL
ncbi:CoA transferase [Amycolatopsis rhizosphaerae]|uniref:CoA transferase n=1 Tax=Amycolatopsis rhizosphaerae TaxID=2053003 RepID=A0A558CBY7_9PSEU|nr:CaiB/BaiF CoA-transferase family protein [Amycolatopsis rhizosphaerae]TVT46227.1 CoA transferase [Amycolatopsis rhizosphaerae]